MPQLTQNLHKSLALQKALALDEVVLRHEHKWLMQPKERDNLISLGQILLSKWQDRERNHAKLSTFSSFQ